MAKRSVADEFRAHQSLLKKNVECPPFASTSFDVSFFSNRTSQSEMKYQSWAPAHGFLLPEMQSFRICSRTEIASGHGKLSLCCSGTLFV